MLIMNKALAGVSVNGKPLKGELQIRSSPALQISWRNNDLHVYPSDILHIQMYGIENSGNPAGKKIIVDVTGDDGITSIVTQSAEVELPTFSCFGFCVSCENDGSCTRCSDGKSVGPDGSCIERCPIGYTDVIQNDGTSTCQPCSVFSCAVCSSGLCSQCLPGSYLYFGFARLVFRAAELVPRNQLVKIAIRDSTYRQTKRRVFPALRIVNNALLRMFA